MVRDIDKVYSAHTASHDGTRIRNVFTVGVIPRTPKAKLRNYVLDQVEPLDFEVKYVEGKVIPNKDLCFILF